MGTIRLQKLIAASGVLSRRRAEEAITQGRVTVNGQVARELGTRADPERDEIRVDGNLLALKEERRVIAFHKPARVITSKADPQGRKTVMEFFPAFLQTIKPVGRLDYDTEGLLILTNDGDFANRLAHPRYGVRKAYLCWVRGRPAPEVLGRLTSRVELEDGPGRFESVKECGPGSEAFEVEVSEGRNRFVRRMWEALGHPVVRLKRIRIGSLELGTLPPGGFRQLSELEVRAIDPMNSPTSL